MTFIIIAAILILIGLPILILTMRFIAQVQHQRRRAAKEAAYRQTIQRRRVIASWLLKAEQLEENKRYKEVVAVLDRIENEFYKDTDFEIRFYLSKASKKWLLNRGLSHPDEAELPPNFAFPEPADDKFSFSIFQRQPTKTISPEARHQQEEEQKSMLRKALSLEKLHRDKEAIAVLEHIESTFRFATHPFVTEKRWEIERKLLEEQYIPSVTYDPSYFQKILQAKQAWMDRPHRETLLLEVTNSLSDALEKLNELKLSVPKGDEAMMWGDLGYALFLLGETDRASQATWECLQLGRSLQLEAQRNAAQQHRIEPEDTAYESMLTTIEAYIYPKKHRET
jgi:hypothetical protein